jgi:hypothetical protein
MIRTVRSTTDSDAQRRSAANSVANSASRSRALQQADDPGRVEPGEGVGERLQRVGAVAAVGHPSGQFHGAAAERRQVGHPDCPAGRGEQPHQRRVVARVGEQPQRGHHLGDRGQVEQAAEADDLGRNAAGAQLGVQLPDVRVAAGQHGDVRPPPHLAAGVGRRDPVGQPREFVRPGRELRHLDLRRRGVGRAHQVEVEPGRRQRRIRAHRPGEVVGRVEDLLAAAAVHGERIPGCRPAVRGREVAREAEDVARRGSSPGVDRLARVTDRGHRVAAAGGGVRAGEQAAQQGGLRR